MVSSEISVQLFPQKLKQNQNTVEITLHKAREILPIQDILPKIACLSRFFLFKFHTVLLESCMKIVLITAGSGPIKQLDSGLVSIFWYVGEMKDFCGYKFDCL